MMIIRGNSQLQSINKTNNQSRKHTSTNNPIAPLSTKHLLFSTSKQQLNDRKKGPNSNFQFKETKLINYSSIPFLIHVANINTSSRSTSTSSPSPPPPPPPINDDAKYGKQQSKSGYKKESAKDNMEKNKTEEIKEKGVKTPSQKEDTAQANKQNSQSGNEKSTVIDDQLFADKYSDENVRRVVEKATKGIKDTFIDTQETGGGNVKNQNEISSARGQEFDRSLDQNAKKVEKTDQKGEDMSRVADSQDRENDKTGKYTGTFKPGSQFDHRSDIDADLTRKAVDKTVQSITSNNHSNANQSSNQSADQSKKSQSDQSSNQSSNQSANQSTQSTQSTDQSKKNAKNDQNNNNNNNSGNNAGGKRTNEASNMESKEYNRRSSENVRSDLNAKNDETNEYLNKTQDKVDQQKNEERQQKQQKMSDQDQKTIDQQIKENITKNMDQKRFEESQAKNQQTNKNINKNDNNNNINKFDNKNDINNDQMKRTKGNENNESKVNYVTDYMSNIANKAGKVINETIDHGIHPSELLNKVKETAENVKDKMGKVVQVVMENTSNKTTGKATENMDRKFSRMEPNMEEGIADDFAYKGNEKEIAKGDYDKNNFNYNNNNDRFSYSKIMEKVKEKANLLQSEISSMGNVKMEGTAQENFHLKNGNEFTLKHPLWETWQVHEISAEYHRAAQTWKDKIAYLMVRALKFDFNLMSGFYFGERTPQKWLTHIIYLETIAGVPASAAALLRHISSLGRLRKDHGWIHSLIEEAENERVHLLTALELKKPNFWIRMGVMGLQISFFTVFTIYYLISPQFCHRWVGYMEEESIKSYTLCLEEMEKENTPMNKWGNEAAPELAKKYWHLDDNATIRDVFLMIRADEAYHRDVNHTFADMNSENVNPFRLH